MNRRREQRVPLEMITLPFLATREEDQQPFEYLLVDVSPSGAQFAIPKWAVSRERLVQDTVINLHLSVLHEGSSFVKAKVVRSYFDDKLYSEVCAVSLFQKMPNHSPFSISALDAGIVADLTRLDSLPAYLSRVIKDCSLLKKGVAVYLKHLIPYLSRIGGYAEADYPMLKDVVLSQIRDKVLKNHAALHTLHQEITAHCSDAKQIPRLLNLEELRALIESEIYPDVFAAAFQSESVAPYISAIKELEGKLYGNYNIAVMIYLLSL